MRNEAIRSLDGSIFDLTTKSVTLWSYSRFSHRVVVKNHRQASKLNRFLSTYPSDTRFVLGDEPVFPFTDNQSATVLKILGIKA